MIKMIRAELYRISKSKGMLIFWLLVIGTFALTVIYKNNGGISLGASLDMSEDIKMDLRQAANNFTYYYLLIIPVFCVIVSEFSEKTWKNAISSSISRARFYIQKFIFTLGFSLLAFVCTNLLFWLVNKAVNGSAYSSPFGDFMKAIGRQLPIITAVVSVFIFLAFLFKKAGIFNSVTIIGPILYTSVALILFSIESTHQIAEKLLKYEISSTLQNLAVQCETGFRNTVWTASGVIAAAAFVAGYFCFTKREIS